MRAFEQLINVNVQITMLNTTGAQGELQYEENNLKLHIKILCSLQSLNIFLA